MINSTLQISFDREIIAQFCQRWQIAEFSLFGSVLRSDFRSDSDIDVLVAFLPQTKRTVFDLLAMREELEKIFGREVDLIEKNTIEQSPNWIRRQEILTTAKSIFIANENGERAFKSNFINFTTPASNSMSRDLATLLDIARFARTIVTIAKGMEETELETDVIKQSAILYQISILGEAVRRLSPEFRSQYPEIPWKNMAGMRDILTHQYDRVNLDIVWDVMQNRIPELLCLIEPLLPTDEET